MTNAIQMPLSNVQVELLRFFADNVPEEDLLEIKKVLVAWRFQKLREAADIAWDEKGYTAEDMERLLHANLRKPYVSQEKYLAKRRLPNA